VVPPGTLVQMGSFTVPAGSDSFAIGLAGEVAGDLNLYVSIGVPPTLMSWHFATATSRVLDFIAGTGGVPPGQYFVAVHNPDPAIATRGHVATAHNEGSLDAEAVAGGLLFLVASQKDDSSWGLGPINVGDTRTSCEALETLLRYGHGGLLEVGAGVGWVLGQQAGDGSFGSVKTTVTCHQMLVYSGTAPAAQRDAYDFIVGAQAADGCYEDALATALSMELLSQKRRQP
jgi:hypothetical protein